MRAVQGRSARPRRVLGGASAGGLAGARHDQGQDGRGHGAEEEGPQGQLAPLAVQGQRRGEDDDQREGRAEIP